MTESRHDGTKTYCSAHRPAQISEVTLWFSQPGAQHAGIAHLDLLHYFQALPSSSPSSSEVQLQAAPALRSSLLLHKTSANPGIDDAAGAQASHTAYTLRLPVHNPRSEARAICEGTEEPAGAGPAYIQIRLEAADVTQVEHTFWRQLVALVDWDQSGNLSKEVRAQTSSESAITALAARLLRASHICKPSGLAPGTRLTALAEDCTASLA